MGVLTDLASSEFEGILVNVTSQLGDFELSAELRHSLESELPGYGFGKFTSHEKKDTDRSSNIAIIPNQYFAYASAMSELALELNKYLERFELIKGNCSDFLGDNVHISNAIHSNSELKKLVGDNDDIDLMAKFLDIDSNSHRLGAKRLFDDNGKPRSARDVFGSAVLKKINLPDNTSQIFGQLVHDLANNPSLFVKLTIEHSNHKNSNTNQSRNGTLSKSQINRTELSKPFLILAGISGTGKTRFVREQAIASGSLDNTYKLVAVRPDWHEPSDLLGYVSRIGTQPTFIVTDVLRFMVQAWKHIQEAGFKLENNTVQGNTTQFDSIPPFWLCLDEMNLAPVEQYFADYLSTLETRQWVHESDNSTYSCDPIISSSILAEFSGESSGRLLREQLGLENDSFTTLWEEFLSNGISLPFNLLVAGTVNMDETTHGFSRKVIDRALTLDFGEFYPNEFASFFKPTTKNVTFEFPRNSDGRNLPKLESTCDKNGKRSVDFLASVNEQLMGTSFQLAYRALNELLLSVISAKPTNEQELQAVWDDFMMTKVLPRVEGDSDKLLVQNEESSFHKDNLLTALLGTLETQFSEIWSGENQQARPDFHRTLILESSEAKKLLIPCRSKRKLLWMSDRLQQATFTSFWP